MVRAQSGRTWKRKAGRVVSLKTTTYHTMAGTASLVILKVVPRLFKLFKLFNRFNLYRHFYMF